MYNTFQNYTVRPVRAAAILTNGYVAGTVIGFDDETLLESQNQLVLLIQLTLGGLASAEIKFEFSTDNVTYFQETFSSISAGTSTDTLGEHVLAASGNYCLAIPLKYRFVRVSAKGTGVVAGSSLQIDSIVGTA